MGRQQSVRANRTSTYTPGNDRLPHAVTAVARPRWPPRSGEVPAQLTEGTSREELSLLEDVPSRNTRRQGRAELLMPGDSSLVCK